MNSLPVTADEIRTAAERIRGVAHRTPVMTSRSFDSVAGIRAFFKCENLQRGGAFKIRGAANFIFSIPKADLRRGVVAFSSGNHAQAVAIAAGVVNTPATVVMPSYAPQSKLAATRGYGAKVIEYGSGSEPREAIAARLAQESGATVVPPFDHSWTIAGQGTVALELLADYPDLDALLVPVGGGGLISGCAIGAKRIRPDIRIFGIEPAAANDTFLSKRAGRRVRIKQTDTIADGLRSPEPGELTFPVIEQLVEEIVLVSEEEIKSAVKFLLARLKILVEPSGAVGAAALLSGKLPPEVRTAGVVLSGGNIDLEQLAQF